MSIADDLNIDFSPLTEFLPKPPDGGYGWVVVAASFFANLVVDGICYAFGIFLSDIQQHFGASMTQTAFVGSLLTGVYQCIGPIASGLVNKFGSRPVTISGSIIACLSMIASIYAPSIHVLMLTYGICGGIGFGLIYLPAIVHCGYYFEKKRALATGLAVSGSGMGTFIFAPFAVILLQNFGWQGSLWILAGCCLNCCISGALLRPLKPVKSPDILQKELIEVERCFTRNVSVLRSRRESECTNKEEISPESPNRDRLLTQQSDMSLLRAALMNTQRMRNMSLCSNQSDADKMNDPDTESPPSVLDTHMTEMPPILEDDTVVLETEDNLMIPPRSPRFLSTSDLNDGGGNTPNPGLLSDKFNASHAAITRKRHTPMASRQVSNVSNISNFSSQPRLTAADYVMSMNRLNSIDSIAAVARSLSTMAKINPAQFNTPMARKDIFYSGSVQNLDEFKENDDDIETYRCNQLSIPMTSSFDEEDADLSDEALKIDHILSQLHLEDYDQKMTFCTWVPHSFRTVCKEMLDINLLRQPAMLLLCLSNVFGMLGFYVPFVYLSSRAFEIGVDRSDAAFLLSIIGVSNTFGRVFFGWLSDRGIASSLTINNLCLLSCGGLTLLVPLLNSYPLMISYSILFGFFISAYMCLTSIILVELLGLTSLTNAFGLILLARGVSCMVGSPLAGAVYDITGSYDYAFILSGALITVAGLISCLVPFSAAIERKLCCIFYGSVSSSAVTKVRIQKHANASKNI